MMYEYNLIYNSSRFYTVFTLLFVIILTSIIITYTLFRVRRKEQRVGALFLNAVILLYQTSLFLVVVSPPKELKVFVIAECIAFCILGPAFYYYNCSLLGKVSINTSKALLFLFPSLIGVVSVLTNSYHFMFYSINNTFFIKYGFFYFLTLIFNLLYALGGYVLILKRFKSKKSFYFQRFLYPLCIVIIIGGGIIDGIRPGNLIYDITPISLTFFQILFLFLNRFLGLSGNLDIGRSSILNNIKESVIMTDMEGKIIFFNDTSFNKETGMKYGVPLAVVLSKAENVQRISRGGDILFHHIDYYKNNSSLDMKSFLGEIITDDGKGCYSYTIKPIGKGRLHGAGALYLFRDITKDKELIKSLDDRNKALITSYDKIKKYSARIGELSAEKERTYILESISKSIEKSILDIILLLKIFNNKELITEKKIEKNMMVSLEIAREGIKEIRKAIYEISNPINKGRKGII